MRFIALSMIFSLLFCTGTLCKGFYPHVEEIAEREATEETAPMHPIAAAHSTRPSIIFLGTIIFRSF